MNPWDLSCRNKLPFVDLNDTTKALVATTTANVAHQVVHQSKPQFTSQQNHLTKHTSFHHIDNQALQANQFLASYHTSHNSNQILAAQVASALANVATTNSIKQLDFPITSIHRHQQRTLAPSTSNSSFYSLSTSPASSSSSSSSISSSVSRSNNGSEVGDGLKMAKMMINSSCSLINNHTINGKPPSFKQICQKVSTQQAANLNNQQQQLQQQQQVLSLLDRKARKKDQNRRAAYNYRRKKMEEKNRMREEEMRLVYSRVCLIGYAEELESSIMYILNTKTKKTIDNDGNANSFLCPVCLQSCDNTMNLRNHLNVIHYPKIIGCQ